MKKSLIALVLGALLAIPSMLRAEEIVIQLSEVIGMSPIPGDNPLDDEGHMVPTPPRPTNFRASVDGNSLTIIKQDEAIPSAQAIVVNASTGGIVLNQQFTISLNEQIANAGVYVLNIETDGGALVGQFIIQ